VQINLLLKNLRRALSFGTFAEIDSLKSVLSESMSDVQASLSDVQASLSDVQASLGMLEKKFQNRAVAYLGNRTLLTTLVSEQPFLVNYPDEGCALGILINGLWEPELSRLIPALINENSNILDIGANLGYYSVVIGSLEFFKGKIHAFEPNPFLRSILQKNIIINRLEQHVTIWDCAISNVNSHIKLNYPPEHLGQGSTNAHHGSEVIEVTTKTIDQIFLDDFVVDFAKIDIEGMEVEAIEGMSAVIYRSPNIVLAIEKNPDIPVSKLSRYWKLLMDLDLKVFNLPETGKDFRRLSKNEFYLFTGTLLALRNVQVLFDATN